MRINSKVLSKSISEIGNWVWEDSVPDDLSSTVEQRFYELHKVPICKLKLADIRFLIGQSECLNILIPIALKALDDNIWLEVEYYKGDLASALLEAQESFYADHPEIKKAIIKSIKKGLDTGDKEISQRDIKEMGLKLHQFTDGASDNNDLMLESESALW